MKKSEIRKKVMLVFVAVVLLMVAVAGGRIYQVRWHNAIFDALNAHDTAKVIALINSGVDPNSTLIINTGRKTTFKYYLDVFGFEHSNHSQTFTILGDACLNSNLEVCKALLEKGADANLANSTGSPPLYFAITGINRKRSPDGIKIVKLLLEHHAKVNDDRPYVLRAISLAADNGMEDVTKLLIDNGADVNYKGTDDGTALYLAAEGGYAGVVKILLNAGADPSIPSSDGVLPIDAASKKGHTDVVDMLKDAIAKRKAGESGASSTKKK